MGELWSGLKGIICCCKLPDEEAAKEHETINAQTELERLQQNTTLQIESETRLSQNHTCQNIILPDERSNAHYSANNRKQEDNVVFIHHSAKPTKDEIEKYRKEIKKINKSKTVKNVESTTPQVKFEGKKSSQKNAHKSNIHRVENDVVELERPDQDTPVKKTSKAANAHKSNIHCVENHVVEPEQPNQGTPVEKTSKPPNAHKSYIHHAENDVVEPKQPNQDTPVEKTIKPPNAHKSYIHHAENDVVEPEQLNQGTPVKNTNTAPNAQNERTLTSNKIERPLNYMSQVAPNVTELDTHENSNFPSAKIELKKKKRRKAVVNREIFNLFRVLQTGVDLYSKIIANDVNFDNYLNDAYFNECHKSTSEFQMVKTKFMRTTQKHFNVIKIDKIFNPFLKASYELRKKEYDLMYGKENVKETLFFHGTKSDYITKIILGNLDWRLAGKTKGHIFGQGVSFTPISNYASNYCDKGNRMKFMLVLNVITCFSCIGTNDMKFPPVCPSAQSPLTRFDTSSKQDGHVVVKYRDDEFYPSYVITYKGSTIRKNNRF